MIRAGLFHNFTVLGSIRFTNRKFRLAKVIQIVFFFFFFGQFAKVIGGCLQESCCPERLRDEFLARLCVLRWDIYLALLSAWDWC